MFDVVTIGSATLDIFIASPQFEEKVIDEVARLTVPYDQKLDIDAAVLSSGGGATNVAVGLSRQGLNVACISEIGKDIAGVTVEQELLREHVDTSFLVKERSEQTATSVLLIANTGARTALVYRGASHLLTPDDIAWDRLESRWIHLSSVENIELVLKVMRFAKERDILLSWNPGNWELKQIQSGALRPDWTAVKLLCVNREEMSILSGLDLSKDEYWKTDWCFAGPEISIVTDGKNGGKYCDHGQCTWFDAEQTKVIQETGAGDAFITGVIAGQIKGMTLEQSVALGKQEAVSVIGHMGAKTGLLRLAVR